jgi:hypothetical protein
MQRLKASGMYIGTSVLQMVKKKSTTKHLAHVAFRRKEEKLAALPQKFLKF